MTFTRFTLLDAAGMPLSHAYCGQDVTLALHYRSNDGEPLRHLHVELEIYGSYHEQLFELSTALEGGDLDEAPAEGFIKVKIPRLPLYPGRFTFDVLCTLNGVIADYLQDAAVLRVESGDFYGTGRLPAASSGPFLVNHRWEVSALPGGQTA